jgi:hypothetical protein
MPWAQLLYVVPQVYISGTPAMVFPTAPVQYEIYWLEPPL